MGRRISKQAATTLAKAPTCLYRLHLGWVFGHRLIMITHRGRRSGRLYRTVVEVVHFDPVSKEAIVTAAFGEKADWYRNIKASPAVEVAIARNRYEPEQRLLAPDEAVPVLHRYREGHVLTSKGLLRFLARFYPALRSPGTAFEDLAGVIPMVAFRPRLG